MAVGVFVVGMHRSGTSAVAAGLEALGLDVGAPERQMTADAANPAGYYELQETGDLNDEILALLGGAWDCLPSPVAGWELEPGMTPYYRRAASIVGKRLAKNRWLVKDPRIAPLLPLWRRAVLDRCAAILIVRDPMEVAWSLALRNGMPILTGLALWSDYNRRALVGLSGLPVHVCSYDELVSSPLETMTSIHASLTSWSELADDANIELAAARIQPELRRNTWPRDNADAIEVPSEIERLAKFLADLGGAHGLFEPGHPPPSPWEEALLGERRTGLVRLRAATSEADAAMRKQVEETTAAIQQRDLTIQQRDVAIQQREEETKVAVQQRDENARRAESVGHQLHARNLELRARNLEFEALGETARADKTHVLAERDRIGRELEAVRARLAEVEADLDEVQTRRRDAEKALRMSMRRLEARERSLPVRVARAFRRVRRR